MKPDLPPKDIVVVDRVFLVDRSVCPADLDGSGAVDFGDLLIVLVAWGPCE